MKQEFHFFRQPITGEGRTDLGSARGEVDMDAQEIRFKRRDELDLQEGDYVSSEALVGRPITSVTSERSEETVTYVVRYG